MASLIVHEQLTAEHGVQALYITPAGEQLFAEQPDELDIFLRAATTLTGKEKEPKAQYGPKFANGDCAHLYAMPDDEAKCIKITTTATFRKTKPLNEYDASIAYLPDLIDEARFMHAVGARLAERPKMGVRAPRQYAAVRCMGGMALLQERIPAEYKTIWSLMTKPGITVKSPEYQNLKNTEATATQRVKQALGHSLLRIGVSDLAKRHGASNRANILIQPELPAEQSSIYVVDLVNARKFRRKLAGNIARIYS